MVNSHRIYFIKENDMIPDFQTLMLPFLKAIANGNECNNKEIVSILGDEFHLTQEELDQWLPSGVQRTFYNRVAWVATYFRNAGLIVNPKRGIFKITQLGQDVLKSKPEKINIRFLKNLQSQDNISKVTPEINNQIIFNDLDIDNISTPEEILETNYITIKKNLASELLTRIKQSSPAFFENLVVELLVKMGYGGSIKDAGKSIGRSGDEGIDGIIKEDKLGLDVIYIQAKRWEGGIGRPEIQKFVGALAGQGAKKGVFITTSKFTKEAKEYHPKNDTKVVLIDGEELAELMIEHNLAVSTVSTFEIKKIDNDYFDDLD